MTGDPAVFTAEEIEAFNRETLAIAMGHPTPLCPTCDKTLVPSFGERVRCTVCNADLLPPEPPK